MPFTAKQHSGTSEERCINCCQIVIPLLWGGAIAGLIMLLASASKLLAYGPGIQTLLNTNLQLNIPKDGKDTYFCLHHDDWSDCIQLKHHGNITFGMAVQRLTPEVHHDQSTVAVIGFLLMVTSFAGIVLLALGFGCYLAFVYLISTISSCTCFSKNDDVFKEDQPPWSERLNQSVIDMESIGQEAEESCGGPHSQQMTAAKMMMMNPQVPSPDDELDGTTVRTIWNVEMEKKIDSHNSTPRFIQAISDKMEDMKNQVKAVTAAFDESIISKGYDFFIIYCGKNSAVVNGIIIPHLTELNITYCEHQEHFIPGRDIFTNIQDCISESRKILAVFSEDFFASGWCCRDLDMARAHATDKQIKDFITPIKIEDCVIPDKYGDLKNITYFDLTSSENDSVWEQIRCSMASIRVASMEMEICMCPEHLQKPFNSCTANTWM